MKKLLLLGLALSLLTVPGAFALGSDDGEWTGEVLDLGCYERNGQHGEGHASCAVRCLNNGSAMGLLIDGDVVYIDLEGSDAEAVETLKNLGGKNANVKGEATKDGEKVTVKVSKAKAA